MAKEPKEKAPPKPKEVGQVTLTVYDDGTITGDFWLWDVNEVGKRKKWTVTGEELMKYLYSAQPRNVPVLASCMNVQLVTAGLPENMQGPWLTRNQDGGVSLQTPEERVTKGELEMSQGNFMADEHSPTRHLAGIENKGTKIAEGQELAAAEDIGLSPGEAAAALPDNQQAQAAAAQAGDPPATPPVTPPLGGAPSA